MLQYAIRQSLGEPETSESSEQVAGLIILQKVQKKKHIEQKTSGKYSPLIRWTSGRRWRVCRQGRAGLASR